MAGENAEARELSGREEFEIQSNVSQHIVTVKFRVQGGSTFL